MDEKGLGQAVVEGYSALCNCSLPVGERWTLPPVLREVQVHKACSMPGLM